MRGEQSESRDKRQAAEQHRDISPSRRRCTSLK